MKVISTAVRWGWAWWSRDDYRGVPGSNLSRNTGYGGWRFSCLSPVL